MAKGKKILTLAYDIPNNDKNITQYWDYLNERMSLSDYDIVVIKPLVYKVENLIEQVQYWRKEFTEFVKNGGVLFVELYKYEKSRPVTSCAPMMFLIMMSYRLIINT